MYNRFSLFVVGAIILASLLGCVSMEEYDQWRDDAYDAERKELERFEELAAEYENGVHFESISNQTVMRGVTGTGLVKDGVYRFAHETESEYAHFHIELGYLKGRVGGELNRVAFLAKARNHGNGFVEVYPGRDIGGDGGNNPSSVEGNGGLTDGGWTLVEFIADGSSTIVKGSTYERTMYGPLESLSIFCFHGASVEIDYILFE
jgi:hypothetical protein